MQLYYNSAKKYKQPIPADAGLRLKYDIKEIRLHPEKLTRSFQEKEQEAKGEQETIHDWEQWGDYQKSLGKQLEKPYPLRKKTTMAKEPEWTLKLEEWGTNKEIEDLEYAHKKRSTIQQEIERRRQEMRRQRRHHRQLEIILSWKDAARYLREKKEIYYARHQIIDLGKPKRTYRASKGKQHTNMPIREYVDWGKGETCT